MPAAPGAPGAHAGAVGAARVVRLGMAGEDFCGLLRGGQRAVGIRDRAVQGRVEPGAHSGRRGAERRIGLRAVGRREAGRDARPRRDRRRRPAQRAGEGTRSSAGVGAERRARRLDDRSVRLVHRRSPKPVGGAETPPGLSADLHPRRSAKPAWLAGRRAAAGGARPARARFRPAHAAALRPADTRRRREAERCHTRHGRSYADQRWSGPRQRSFCGSWRRIGGCMGWT